MTSAQADLQETLDGIYEEGAIQRELESDDFRGFERLFTWIEKYGAPLGIVAITLSFILVLILAAHLLESRRSSFLIQRKSLAGASGELIMQGDDRLNSLDALLDHTDALAREGYYAEAIHELLLGVLDRLKSDFHLNWRPAQTAREILASQGGAEQGLERLVKTTEELYFGGIAGSEEIYKSCRVVLPGILNSFAVPERHG